MGDVTLDEILRLRFVNYSAPLELAKRWLRSDDKQQQRDSRRLLEALFQRFSHSIEVGQQLAFSCLETGDQAAAKRVLDRIDALCRNPQEEVLARRGRMARDEGDRHLAGPNGQGATSHEALTYYRLALKHYETAWKIRGCHYPGINVATLHLLIAALELDPAERARQLTACESVVAQVLASRATWPFEMPDDPVWHAATAGEAHLLQRDFPAAAECYRTAQRHERFLRGHLKSMRPQVERILNAFRRLDIADVGEFGDLDVLLPDPDRTPGDCGEPQLPE